MNIFDFDGTIYQGDSTVDFLLYCVRCHPSLLRCLPGQALAAGKFVLGAMEKTAFKQKIYGMFRYCDVPALLEPFWDTHAHKIAPWYRERHQQTDIVISASPEFLLAPICARLGVASLIASRVDPATGVYTGVNCHGAEKVVRLKAELGIDHCEEFYSDSYVDQPLADISNQAFLIKKGQVLPWRQK